MLSVIIPVYNSEEYLPRLFDCLLSQTCKDFEVLLVDDGSTDSSLQLLEEYATRDPRFKVFHQENSGVSVARNLGLENARGEVVTFIDSDDYVTNDYCEWILQNVSDLDLMVFQAEKHFSDGCGEIKISKLVACEGRNVVEECLRFLHSGREDQFGWPWNKTFRNDIIRLHNLRFPEGISWFEDEVFMLRYAQYVRKMEVKDEVLYHYVIRDGSLTTNNLTPLKYDSVADALDAELVNYQNENFINGFRRQIYWLYLCAAQKETNRQEMRERFYKVREYYRKYRNVLPEQGKFGKIIFGLPDPFGYWCFLIKGKRL